MDIFLICRMICMICMICTKYDLAHVAGEPYDLHDLYDLAHVAGWERYNLHGLGPVPCVVSVLRVYADPAQRHTTAG